MSFQLRMVQVMRCSVCGTARDDEASHEFGVVVALVGANWDGLIREGRCPQCLLEATYKPRTVRRRWLKRIRENQA
jgi:hypothetical protein